VQLWTGLRLKHTNKQTSLVTLTLTYLVATESYSCGYNFTRTNESVWQTGCMFCGHPVGFPRSVAAQTLGSPPNRTEPSHSQTSQSMPGNANTKPPHYAAQTCCTSEAAQDDREHTYKKKRFAVAACAQTSRARGQRRR
jgi:hypothetical protein